MNKIKLIMDIRNYNVYKANDHLRFMDDAMYLCGLEESFENFMLYDKAWNKVKDTNNFLEILLVLWDLVEK